MNEQERLAEQDRINGWDKVGAYNPRTGLFNTYPGLPKPVWKMDARKLVNILIEKNK